MGPAMIESAILISLRHCSAAACCQDCSWFSWCCFLPRDFRCFGGYFQADYLAKCSRVLCKALRATGRAGLAEVIAARETSGYLSGPLFLTNARGTPLSMAELIAHPLTKAALTEKLALSLHDAHLAGIGDLYQTVVPPAERMKGWEGR